MKTKIIETDTSLVSRYLAGDKVAFEYLVKRYKNKVYSTIYLIVKDKEVAEDLMQDAFIKAIDKLKSGTYNEEGKFGPWIVRMAYNMAIDHFRREKRYPSINIEDTVAVYNSLTYSVEPVENEHIRNNTEELLKQLIETLPETQKEVLMMRHYGDMSFQEIAAATGVSINTALGRMRYALLNLRKKMQLTDELYDQNLYA